MKTTTYNTKLATQAYWSNRKARVQQHQTFYLTNNNTRQKPKYFLL